MPPIDARTIFLDALERPSASRAAFLDDACGQSFMLRRDVEALLMAHEAASGFLADPDGAPTTEGRTTTFSAAPVPAVSRSALEGTTLGPYRLEACLGEGGFGVVYRAQQEHPIRRTVAIKFIRHGAGSESAVRRFEIERQALAMMQHDGIARILDAGQTDQGQPYFVMEYVEGDTIGAYCDHAGMGIRDRLALFIRVCEAVAHAHRRGIIHRDLKPGNILITADNGHPSPRVIDFGIAKALGDDAGAPIDLTHPRQMLGTPMYMAPEQTGLAPADTRTDVYALGIVLYELLCGLPPFDRERLASVSIFELARIIRDEEPLRPSARLIALGDAGDAIAAQRGVETLGLWRALCGDLDNLVLRAIAKDPAHRYASVEALAADARRYLDGLPLEAGPQSRRYRLKKLIRRHPIESAAIALAAASLVLLAAVSIFVASEQASQRARLEAQTVRSDAAADFARSVLESVDPAIARGQDTALLRQILDDAATRVTTELADHPEAAVDMLMTLGLAHWRIGELARAETLLTAARQRAIDQSGPASDSAQAATGLLASVLTESARHDEAIALHTQVYEARVATFGPDDALSESALLNLATASSRAGRTDSARPLFERLYEQRSRRLGPTHEDTLTVANNLAVLLSDIGHDAEAAALLSTVYEAQRAGLGIDHPRTLATAHNLAGALDEADDRARAISLLEETIEHKSRVLGPSHPSTLLSMSALGSLLSREGRSAEAEAMLRRALQASEANPDDPRRAGLLNSLGGVLMREGRHDEAEPFVREAFELMTSLAGPDHPHALQLAANLASVLLTLDRPAEARPVAHDAHARAIERLGLTHRTSIDLCVHLARALAHSGEADEARALLSRHREACQSEALTDQHARIEAVMHEIEALSAPIEPGEPHG